MAQLLSIDPLTKSLVQLNTIVFDKVFLSFRSPNLFKKMGVIKERI